MNRPSLKSIVLTAMIIIIGLGIVIFFIMNQYILELELHNQYPSSETQKETVDSATMIVEGTEKIAEHNFPPESESTLSDMERQSIERHKIEPELEQRLRIAQQSVNDSELPVTGTSVSGIHKALVIYIDSTQLTADKNRTYYTELIQNRYSDIPVIVRFGESKLESCTVPTSNCDP